MELTGVVMSLKDNPADSWKAMRILEKGSSHHHTQCRMITTWKDTGEKATADEENAEFFVKNFSKVFNNPDHVPCNDTSLPLVLQHEEFTFLGNPLVYEEVHTAIMQMVNGKSPGPSGVTSDAFYVMVWCEADPEQTGLNIDAEHLCQYTTDILGLFWDGNLDVESWRTGNFSSVLKPGDLSDQKNGSLPACLRPCTRFWNLF
eukprot:2197770-Ditylum_brightwellii.AAC.1